MSEYVVWVSGRAQADLNAAKAYIERHAPEAADRWYDDAVTAMLDLEVNPQGRPLAPENNKVPFTLREYIFRSKSGRANRALFTIVDKQSKSSRRSPPRPGSRGA